MTTVRTILAAVAGVATLASLAAADSIDLRRSIRRDAADRPIVLRDIAVLDGADAERFADLEIAAADDLPIDRPAMIDVAEVRSRLDAAGIVWGRVDLTGGAVRVRPAIAPVAAATPATAGASPRFTAEVDADGTSESTPLGPAAARASDLLIGPETDPAAVIARLVLDDLAAIEPDPARVQLSIDLSALADMPKDAGDCRIRLRGRGDVDHVLADVSCRLDDGRRRSWLVPVDVRVLRAVPVAGRRIPRGRHLLGLDADLALDLRPCRPSDPRIDVAALAGRETIATIDEGERIVPSMLKPEIVVQKGTSVIVRLVSGGFELRREMEAAGDGALGDRIPCFEPASRGRGASITAVVVGPGLLEIR